MSGLIHKVKDALTGGHDTAHDSNTTTTSSTHRAGTTTGAHDTAGPHRSDIANKADPRVDSDRDGRSGLSGTGKSTGMGGYGSHTTAGPHGSDAANKLDPRVDSDRDGSNRVGGGYSGAGTLGGAGTHHTTAGPHSSDLANKADPRVDSDRDGRGLGHHTGGGIGYGTTGGSGLTGSHHTTAGPHSSDLANKADPRVDSDRDGSRFSSGNGPLGGTTGIHSGTDTFGRHDTHSHTHNTNPVVLNAGGSHGTSGYGTTGSGLTGSHHTTAGPHSSDLANRADPRVDSDRDGRGLGHGTHGTTGAGLGGIGGTHNKTTAGPHSSNLANKADPRVDSDLDGSRHGHGVNAYGETPPGDINDRRAHNQVGHMETLHTKGSSAAHGGTSHADPRFDNHGTSGTAGLTGVGTHGTHGSTGTTGSHHTGAGPAPNTAGPHKSDLLNKLDPRVDSNLDGSKTVGGNKTFDHGNTSGTTGHQ